MNKRPHRLDFLLAAALIAASACTPPVSVAPTPSPSGVSASPGATPGATITAQPTAAPPPGAASASTPRITTPLSSATPGRTFPVVPYSPADLRATVQTRGLGTLGGDWVFMIRRSFEFSPNVPSDHRPDRARDAVEFLPLDSEPFDRRTSTVAEFRSALGGGIAPSNRIASQLSPDGSRLVLSVGFKRADGREHLGLVLIELSTGALSQMTDDPSYHDDTPAWSPDGRSVIFSRRSSVTGEEAGLWLAGAHASSNVMAIRLPPGAGRLLVHQWTPDGRFVAFSRGSGPYEFIEPFTFAVGMPSLVSSPPSVTTSFGKATHAFRDASDWRSARPQFVGAFTHSGGRQSIEVAAGPAGSLRSVIDDPGRNGILLLRPRWRPNSDDVLYLRTEHPDRPGRLWIADAASGTAAQVPAGPSTHYAEWTPDGAHIAWVDGTGIAVNIRVARPDGSGERVIYVTGGAPEASVRTVDFGTARF